MKKNDIYYYLGFSHVLGIGPIKLNALIKYFGDVKKAYHGEDEEIKKVIGLKTGEKFISFRHQFDPVKKLEELNKESIEVLTLEDGKYPPELKNIADPPICLYVRGKQDNFDFSKDMLIGIVGTRNPTQYGQQITRKFAQELIEAGIVVVSGMALGIDSIAHWTALNNKGKTIAILGCGVNVVYPAVNRGLYWKIIENGGLVISEFPPGRVVEKGLFISRNRIISGLSKGVIIIEGLKDSGSLITARHAAEQGREVFAPPGPITSSMSQAPNMLIKQGAKLVTSVEDIYEELKIKIVPAKKEKIELHLSDREKAVFELLQKEQCLMIDDIANKLNLVIGEILDTVSVLEIKGIIEKNNEGKYQIKFS